ncbi:hypothetical protein ACXZ7L_03880 [Vibrio campbellii]|nr:GNAT family N-acetyltransferase [Vibrio campbellii]
MSYRIMLWDGAQAGLNEYANLLSENYSRCIEPSFLEWKHKLNPLGASVIAFAYDGEKLVAARAFQRAYSFSNDKAIYQPCDTVTHQNYRKKGLFRKLTQLCLNSIDIKNSLIINFPNDNSEPAYLKLGWSKYHNLSKEYSFSCVNLGKPINNEDVLIWCKNQKDIDFSNYVKWRFIENPNVKYKISILGKALLIQNGRMVGVLSIDGKDITNKPFGLSVQYTTSIKKIRVRKWTIGLISKSGSRIVFNNSSRKEIDDVFSHYSPLALMDTF